MTMSVFPQLAFGEAPPPVPAQDLPAAATVAGSIADARSAVEAPAAIDANPVPIQFFYIPFPEQQVQNAYKIIATQSGTAMTSVTSISVTANNTKLYYDQWEDGYELDVTNFTQSSTKLWGDGNTANGNACPSCSLHPCARTMCSRPAR